MTSEQVGDATLRRAAAFNSRITLGESRSNSEKNRLAEEVLELLVSFQMALSNKRKYPVAEFTSFVASEADKSAANAGAREASPCDPRFGGRTSGAI